MKKSEAEAAGLMQSLNEADVFPEFVLYEGQLIYGVANIERDALPGIFEKFVPGYVRVSTPQ